MAKTSNKNNKKKSKKKDEESKKFDYVDDDFRTKEIVTRIKFLQNLIDNFVQKTEKSKVEIADLEKQVKILDETHKVNYKSATETSLQNAKRESRRVIGRIVHQLENGLNNMLQKKGAEFQFQQTQKELIDDYRIERKGLVENTKLLENKLQKAKIKLQISALLNYMLSEDAHQLIKILKLRIVSKNTACKCYTINTL